MTMRERPCLVDGRAGDCGFLPDGLYVWQNIRTTGCRGEGVGRHHELLDYAAREVLGFGVEVGAEELDRQINRLLADNGYPPDAFSYVTVRQYVSGELVVAAREIFPYRERKLRIVSPQAAIVDYDLPFSEQPTSMSESAARIALAGVQMHDPQLRCVIRRNGRGEIVSADGSPLFIVEEGMIVAPPPEVPSVWFERVVRAASGSGTAFSCETVDADRLLAAEELFFADHRGVTAVSRCEGHIYIHLLAERIGRLF